MALTFKFSEYGAGGKAAAKMEVSFEESSGKILLSINLHNTSPVRLKQRVLQEAVLILENL